MHNHRNVAETKPRVVEVQRSANILTSDKLFTYKNSNNSRTAPLPPSHSNIEQNQPYEETKYSCFNADNDSLAMI